jgi:exodeoxyribonuclease VII small subunit
MNDADSNGKSACEEMSFERSLVELEAIVHDLEDGKLGLTEALARYEQGVKHLQHCYKVLEASERKIEQLIGVAEDGTAQTAPFEESDSSLAESAGRRKRAKRAAAASDDADDIGNPGRAT